MKKLKYFTVALMLGLLVFLTSSTEPVTKQTDYAGRTNARFHRGMHRGMNQGMNFSMFNTLTDEQKDQIEKIRIENMKKALPVKNQINEKKAELRTLTTGDNIDMKAAGKVLANIEDLKSELAKQMVRTRLDIRNVLNDEQKIMFDARSGMQGKHGMGFAGKGFGMNGRIGQGRPMPCAGRGRMQGQPGMQKGRGMATGGMQGPGQKGMQQGPKPGMGKGMQAVGGQGYGPAQGNGMQGRPGMNAPQGRMQAQGPAWIKDLTDEQKDQLKTLHLKQIKAMTGFKNQLGEYKAKLRILTTSDDIKLKDIDKVIEKMEKVKLEMANEKLSHRMDVRALLTDEQKVLFDMQAGKGMCKKGML